MAKIEKKIFFEKKFEILLFYFCLLLLHPEEKNVFIKEYIERIERKANTNHFTFRFTNSFLNQIYCFFFLLKKYLKNTCEGVHF